jgi:hypothetical protein
MCGASLVEQEIPSAAAGDGECSQGEQFKEAVQDKLQAGMPFEMAVESSSSEVEAEENGQSHPDSDDKELEPQTCPTCGKPNPGDARRCMECEAPLKYFEQISPDACHNDTQPSLDTAPGEGEKAQMIFRLGLTCLVITIYVWAWGPISLKVWVIKNKFTLSAVAAVALICGRLGWHMWRMVRVLSSHISDDVQKKIGGANRT